MKKEKKLTIKDFNKKEWYEDVLKYIHKQMKEELKEEIKLKLKGALKEKVLFDIDEIFKERCGV